MADRRRRIKPFAGDMDDYARFVLERAKTGIAPAQADAGMQTGEEAGAPAAFDAAAAARLAAKKAKQKRRRRVAL